MALARTNHAHTNSLGRLLDVTRVWPGITTNAPNSGSHVPVDRTHSALHLCAQKTGPHNPWCRSCPANSSPGVTTGKDTMVKPRAARAVSKNSAVTISKDATVKHQTALQLLLQEKTFQQRIPLSVPTNHHQQGADGVTHGNEHKSTRPRRAKALFLPT